MRLAAIAACLFGLILSGCSGATLLNAVTSESGLDVERGIAYGPEKRQRYDLYRPAAKEAEALIIFYYGGSWKSGNRGMYEFVGATLAKEGFAVAIPDYRLHPNVQFPVFVEDAALAFSAISRDAGGGLPVFVMGHSAGAHIGGLLTFDKRYLNRQGLDPCGAIAGFIGLAGPYNFDITDEWKPIFPPETRGRSQVVDFAGGRHPRSLLVHGLDDDTVHALDTRQMSKALRRSGNRVETELLKGVNHVDIVAAFSWPLRSSAPTLSLVTNFIRKNSKITPGCGR
ncbi:alpha/beta hydrolase [Notoacmeibacter sp. MSK16QG-6]|uniref:alpha/beta hydrolase n=1 Tax=Notoacmeibacter sp. MSK16QG-6 TaxID=2957982 RepID=UPI00209D7363|nr:alpha/beta hydrolase [Notoacmeibacter sp. MSK16QG-6]MCP1200384.1 alpha/beta hydrolase [Notoacmeibacter sp. MSK16QG-6]